MEEGLLRGKDGELSSKRLAGFILVIGVLVIAVFAIIQDPAQAGEVLWPLTSFGSVCFGATAVERLGAKK